MKIICRQSHVADEERNRLADEVAQLRAAVKALTTERNDTAERNRLREQVETLKVEKGRLVEENDRKIRETEHATGLLRKQTEQDIANARRDTELRVREENLAADKKRFSDEMEFQRKHLQGEVDRVGRILGQILERLPAINVELTGGVSTRKPAAVKEG